MMRNFISKYFEGFIFCILMKRNFLIVINSTRFCFWMEDGKDVTWTEFTGWFLFGIIPIVLWEAVD